MNKKALILALSFVMLTGCGNKTDDTKSTVSNKASVESNEKVEEDNKSNTKEESKDKSKILSKDDEWVVDGQWKLKILDVKTTDDRNEFSEKEPKQVVIVSYSYENIGYEDEING